MILDFLLEIYGEKEILGSPRWKHQHVLGVR